MMTEKSWVMMMHWADYKHEENEQACSTSEVRHTAKSDFVILRLESTDGWRRVTSVGDRVNREGCTDMR